MTVPVEVTCRGKKLLSEKLETKTAFSLSFNLYKAIKLSEKEKKKGCIALGIDLEFLAAKTNLESRQRF